MCENGDERKAPISKIGNFTIFLKLILTVFSIYFLFQNIRIQLSVGTRIISIPDVVLGGNIYCEDEVFLSRLFSTTHCH